MNYIKIGKIVNTHGIKGELRIISDFPYKDRVFMKDFNIYIGINKTKEVINSYRHHKIFDMITLKNYNNINEVLKYKGSLVYIKRDDLILKDNEYLDSDLIGFSVIINNKLIGTVLDFENHSINKIMVVKNNLKVVLIPYNYDIIDSIDTIKKEIIIKNIEGLI